VKTKNQFMALIGSRGGSNGRGKAKARTHAQAVKAGLASAAKYRERKLKKSLQRQQAACRINTMKTENQKIAGQYRQGDVLIERVDVAPTGESEPKTKITLAEGEVTGHSHVLECGSVPADWWKEERVAVVKAPAQVTHQEHATVSLMPGPHRITRQREYTPEGLINVAD